MFNYKMLAVTAAIVPSMLIVGLATAQEYPDRPVRIVASTAGGGSDLAARMVSAGITEALGQPLPVENTSSSAAPEIVVRAPADGYTTLVLGAGFWTGPLTRATAYDPIADFAPVSTISQAPQVLVVTPSLAVNSVEELIALAKAEPGSLDYASGPQGGNTHLAGEMFKAMAEIEVTNIPFSDGAMLLQALFSGEVDYAFEGIASVQQHIESGRLRAIATTGLQPTPLMPDLPTVHDVVPGFEMSARTAMFVRSGTPEPIIARLNKEISTYLQTPEAQALYLAQGAEAVGSTPEELAAAVASETERLGAIIQQLGLGPQ